MYVCVYVCMYVFMYVCIYELCIYDCTICMYVYMYVCMYVCVYVCIYVLYFFRTWSLFCDRCIHDKYETHYTVHQTLLSQCAIKPSILYLELSLKISKNNFGGSSVVCDVRTTEGRTD